MFFEMFFVFGYLFEYSRRFCWDFGFHLFDGGIFRFWIIFWRVDFNRRRRSFSCIVTRNTCFNRFFVDLGWIMIGWWRGFWWGYFWIQVVDWGESTLKRFDVSFISWCWVIFPYDDGGMIECYECVNLWLKGYWIWQFEDWYQFDAMWLDQLRITDPLLLGLELELMVF